MNKVFESFKIKSVEFKNRIGVSPMCMYSSEQGYSNDWHLVHLGSRAVGGAAMVMVEATAVSEEGRITPYDLGIYFPEHVGGLKRIASFIQSQNCVPAIQLAHAGRKASHSRPWEGSKPILNTHGGWITVAPSSLPYKPSDPLPKALNAEEIKSLIQKFRVAAERAYEAGFRVIEIHAAHGYLINQFLSPLSNNRTDEYGGSFENRIRFLCEIIVEVRKKWPSHLPLFVRISCTEWVEAGWSLNDSIQLAQVLKTLDVDLIDCSSGGNSSSQVIPVKPLYQTPFSKAIKQQTGLATAAVGLITTIDECKTIIEQNMADIVLMAREFLRNPYFPLNHSNEANGVTWPPQYERAKPK